MSQDVDYVRGWPAVIWVSGVGIALLAGALLLWSLARSTPSRPELSETYRAEGRPADRRAEELRALAIVLTVVCGASQLLYVGVYVELVDWLGGGRDEPRIVFGLFAWILVISVTVLGASIHAAFKSRPRS